MPQVRVRRLVGGRALVPLLLEPRAALHRLAEVGERLVRDEERLERRPAVRLLRQLDLLAAERAAVGLARVLLVRAALGDVRPQDHERRAVVDVDRRPGGLLQAPQLEVLPEVLDMPAVGLEAPLDVLRERPLGWAVELDLVVVVEDDERAQAEMP